MHVPRAINVHLARNASDEDSARTRDREADAEGEARVRQGVEAQAGVGSDVVLRRGEEIRRRSRQHVQTGRRSGKLRRRKKSGG